MASDRARISYDPARAYRAVVAQQGRVTLEADVNEAGLIESEALRLETIDIVGPAGTPDDGYKVIPAGGSSQITIGAGIYYLGGWRLNLDQPVAINAQPDWLDAPPLPEGGNDLVSLLITEQSVCAVEDQALREVALGGPDSAARLRLMQHFLLLSMDGDTCADGAAVVDKLLAADGVSLDPYSDQLVSSATLQVGFLPDGAPPDPCSPAAAGGYLGADNQLIRVTVSAFDPQTKTGDILWGWNNASILYRAALTDKTAGVFTLTGAPIDQEHAPQLGQAVEILRIRANLKGSNFIAADSGFVTTVAQAYSFDTGTLTISDTLPAEYQSDPGPFFVRLWQAIVPFTAGQPTALDTVSGLTVTVNLAALPTQIAARPFWRFAVRPDTPVQIYPERYQDGPQGPDGPRQWLCDLGVVGFSGESFVLLADCRPTFVALTEETCGCCGLTLDPAGVDVRGGLQAVVDSLVGGPAVLSLKPGDYILRAPLVLTGDHRRLTIEGCTFGASIRPDPANLAAFALGLIILEKADALTLRRLELDVPAVLSGQAATVAAGAAGGGTVCGVMVADCGLVTIEDCAFGIKAPNDGRTQGLVFGGAVAIVGRAVDLIIRRNMFVGKAIFEGGLVAGVIGSVNTQNVHTALIEVEISDNYFERLNLAVFAYARLGVVRCASNRVKNCTTGLFFAETQLGATGQFAKLAVTGANEISNLAQVVQNGFPAHLLAMSAQSQAPFFSRMAAPAEVQASKVAQGVLVKDMTARGQAAWSEIAQAGAQRQAAPSASASAAPGPEAATKAAAATAAPKARATPKAAAAAGQAEYVANLTQVQTVAVAAELAAYPLTAALHILDNDITLAKTPAKANAGIGIGVITSPRDDVVMVMMNGNRVVCPDNRTSGATLFFPTFATVTGNMLIHPAGTQGTFTFPVFASIGLESGHYVYAGNLFSSGASITPARTAPAPSPDWAFLNTAT